MSLGSRTPDPEATARQVDRSFNPSPTSCFPGCEDCLGGAASRAERFAETGDTDVLLENLPNLETPFEVEQGLTRLFSTPSVFESNLPEDPCTYDCTDCMAAGRCLDDCPPQDEGYVHTDDDAPAPVRTVDRVGAVLASLRISQAYNTAPLERDIQELERLYADLLILAQ